MIHFTLKELAEKIQGRLQGDPDQRIEGIAALHEAEPGDISVVFDLKLVARINKSRASALVIPMKFQDIPGNVIRVPNPRLALIQLLHLFHPRPPVEPGIHERAVIAEGVRLGEGVFIDSGVVIKKDGVIGEGTAIHPNVTIGEGCHIGRESEIFPNVTIYPGTQIGDRVRIHAGTVIGSDGFGYTMLETGKHEKIPQVGRVVIEDDVEIGANCTIDRATLGATRILAGTKIDNMVQIGHNSEIGEHTIIVAQSGISGSVRMGDHCVLAGQVGISDHVELKPGTIIGAKSGVIRDIGPGRWAGYPAVPVIKALRAYHLLFELPDLNREVQDLKKRLSEMET
jgi:UDP-3-O-[3-hydroxymyristoyl] glucosamine N-acyltransferase